MNKKSIKWVLFLAIIYAQDYTLDDCIQIAIDGKKTVLSAELGVVHGLKDLIVGCFHLSKQQQWARHD